MSAESILIDFGTKLVKDVQKNLQDKQKEKAAKYGTSYNANSALVNSVKFYINGVANPSGVESDGTLTFELRMNDYFDLVDRGRKSGNVSEGGSKSISEWIRRKGINVKKIIEEMREKAKLKNPPKTLRTRAKKNLTYEVARKQFTYLVSRKIKMKGFEGNFFYTEIISDGRLEKLQKDLVIELGNQIKIQF